MKPVRFHPAAARDLQDQTNYYEAQSPGLGWRFVQQGIGVAYKYSTRRVFPKDFPHAVIYRETPDLIMVLAVAAFRRKPDYWRERK